jgi:Family of unknown function (DUF6011)
MYTVQELAAALPTLPPSKQGFAASLIEQSARRALSDKQLFWVNKLTEDARRPVAPAPTAVNVGNLAGIQALFNKARQHLKFPAIVMSVPAAGLAIRINVAGPSARYPGSLNVTSGEKPSPGERREWYGRVQRDGAYEPSAKAGPSALSISERLVAFAADPAGIAAEHGRLTGRCCFCNIALSDERSTNVGYGKTCAGHYGLPWGER